MSELTLMAFESLVDHSTLYGSKFSEDLTGNHEGYQHVISAVGGFDTAGFTLLGTRDYLDEWFESGLFRQVIMYNPEGLSVWEGFISALRYGIGSLQKTKSIENMFNRVYLRYTPTVVTSSKTVEGKPTTLIVNDLNSQALYGVKAATIGGGARQSTLAYDWARTVLKASKDPQIGEAVNPGGGDAPKLEVDCLGFVHTLKWLPYITTRTGTVQSHQVVQEVLSYFNAINGGFIDQNFGMMDYNFQLSNRGADDFISCWDMLANTIRQGGKGGERWVGGVYWDRQFIYKSAEDFEGMYAEYLELYRALDDPAQAIYDSQSGAEVRPWDMLPDRILRTVDV